MVKKGLLTKSSHVVLYAQGKVKPEGFHLGTLHGRRLSAIFFKNFIYLFLRDTHTHTHTHTEREWGVAERERGRERIPSILSVQSPVGGLISGTMRS